MMTDPRPSTIDFDELAAEAQAAVKIEVLGRLAKNLGLSINSLRQLGVGWLVQRRAWGFPMKTADGRVVGIRLRLPSGRKLSVKGGREGLFLPSGLKPGGRLLVAEGPTDTAALLDLGFLAVGRPNCTGGVKHLVALARRLRPESIVIVADADAPGQRGAKALVGRLVAYVPLVRIITAPLGVKDARGWTQAGATAADLQAAIEAAPVRRLQVKMVMRGRR